MLQNRFRGLIRISGAAALMAACYLPAMAQTYVPLPQSVIVFPFDKPDAVDQSVPDTVVNGIRSRMDRVQGYDTTTFNPRSPLIRRAIQGGDLTQTQVAGPFDAPSGAAVAKAAGVDDALVGSIESATADAGTATVSVSVQLVSARDASVQKTAGVTGTSTQAGLAPDALLRAAADDAAAKATAQIFGSSNTAAAVAPGTGSAVIPTAPGTQPPAVGATNPATTPNTAAPAGLPTGSIPTVNSGKKKHGNSGLILGGLALLGIIIAASGGGGGGGGGGGNNGGGGPPVFPF
jgi:hypothetical protein